MKVREAARASSGALFEGYDALRSLGAGVLGARRTAA
jgi:hypothetical protein